MHYVMASATIVEIALEKLENTIELLKKDNYAVYLQDAPVVFERGTLVYIIQKVIVKHDKPPEYHFEYTTPQVIPFQQEDATYTTIIETNQLP